MIRSVRVLPLALLGVLVAHQVTYERMPAVQATAAAGDVTHDHAGMMTAQSWLPSLPVGLLLVAILGLLTAALIRPAKDGCQRIPGLPAVVAAQVSLSLLISVADRAVHGCSLLPAAGPLAAGVAIQVLFAAAGWAAMTFALIAIRGVAARWERVDVPPLAVRAAVPFDADAVIRLLVPSLLVLRGPPLA